MICRICGNKENNAIVAVTEKMFGSKELFEYIHCAHCGCLQLLDENMDMTPYYPPQYFSFNDKYYPNIFKDFLGKEYIKFRLGKISLIGMITYLFMKQNQSWIHKKYLSFDSKILDVGCGSGRLLHLLYHRGFKNLSGLDPFNKNEIIYNEKLKIYNHTIFEHSGKYDFIMLHYSFEHMTEIHKVIQKLLELLENNGTILIRIPILDSFAYRKYNQNWVQMDAPRHIHLFTIQSVMMLFSQYNLFPDKIEYESSEFQFIQSEKYRRSLTYSDTLNISKKDKREFKKFANHLNKIKDGDQVSFYLKKNDSNVK